jgi:hypothetical protein
LRWDIFSTPWKFADKAFTAEGKENAEEFQIKNQKYFIWVLRFLLFSAFFAFSAVNRTASTAELAEGAEAFLIRYIDLDV